MSVSMPHPIARAARTAETRFSLDRHGPSRLPRCARTTGMSRHARGCKPGTAKPSRSVMSDLKNFAGKPALACRTRDQASEDRLYWGGWGGWVEWQTRRITESPARVAGAARRSIRSVGRRARTAIATPTRIRAIRLDFLLITSRLSSGFRLDTSACSCRRSNEPQAPPIFPLARGAPPPRRTNADARSRILLVLGSHGRRRCPRPTRPTCPTCPTCPIYPS